MVSIFSPHFINWTEQLRDSGHEVYWFDVNGSGVYVKKINFVTHITNWKYRVDYPGRYFVKSKLKPLDILIKKVNERDLIKVFEQKLKEIKPDVVHSFVMYLGAAPILKIMLKYSELKWIYSAWGSDMFYYSNQKFHLRDINRTLPRLNYMFADCYRDFHIAKKFGFKGEFLGKFPGGGGYDFEQFNKFMLPFARRNCILIKGYQGKHGKCIQVLEAIQNLRDFLKEFQICVFGIDSDVKKYLKSSDMNALENLQIYERISHTEVIKLMGSAIIYIGNSSSDGTPNTLLEAIIMGAFPIQSNPGGATAELIQDGKNGYLIEDPENSEQIGFLIQKALKNRELLESAIVNNNLKVKPELKRDFIKKKVLAKYKLIEEELKN